MGGRAAALAPSRGNAPAPVIECPSTTQRQNHDVPVHSSKDGTLHDLAVADAEGFDGRVTDPFVAPMRQHGEGAPERAAGRARGQVRACVTATQRREGRAQTVVAESELVVVARAFEHDDELRLAAPLRDPSCCLLVRLALPVSHPAIDIRESAAYRHARSESDREHERRARVASRSAARSADVRCSRPSHGKRDELTQREAREGIEEGEILGMEERRLYHTVVQGRGDGQ